MQKSVLSLDELFFEQLKKLYQDISVQVSILIVSAITTPEPFGFQVTVTLKCHRSCASPNNTKIMVSLPPVIII